MDQITMQPTIDVTGDGWTKMFDGKTLDGWQALMNPHVWRVEDGMIVGSDSTVNSLLFYIGNEVLGGPVPPKSHYRVTDFEFKADIKLRPLGVSSMYFRARPEPAGPDDIGVAPGYIAQANNSATDIDPRTGSLYGMENVYEQLVADDTWWTQHVIAIGDHIQIFVNGERVVDFRDPKNLYREGYLALLVLGEWAPTTVYFKNLMLRQIPKGPGIPRPTRR